MDFIYKAVLLTVIRYLALEVDTSSKYSRAAKRLQQATKLHNC
jgi:hypothetical protein